jgi:hypothetical protein
VAQKLLIKITKVENAAKNIMNSPLTSSSLVIIINIRAKNTFPKTHFNTNLNFAYLNAEPRDFPVS